MTTTTGLEITHLDENQDSPDITVNAAFDRFDVAIAGMLTHAVATDGDYTLATGSSPPEWVFPVVQVTDTGATLTAGRNIVVPSNVKPYMLVNETAQILTLKTATGSGIAVAASRAAPVMCDGSDVFRLGADSVLT